jgi:hypothetical protein
MILAIAVLLLHIPAIPQNSISTVSDATVTPQPAATAKTLSCASSEPMNSTATTPQKWCQDPQLDRTAFAAPILQDRSEKLRRRNWLLLTIAQHSAATFDAWSTRQAISSGHALELNPMLRPFSGNASIYAVTQVFPVLFDYLGRRMMTSHHGWARHTWWIPQAVSTAASLASGAHNLTVR